MPSGSRMNRKDQQFPNAIVEILRGKAKIKFRQLMSPVFLIGRAHDCDLVLGDPQFPDLHTYLFVQDDLVNLRFLGQGPEVKVQGVSCVRSELVDQTVFSLGNYEFRLHLSFPMDGVPVDKRKPALDPAAPQWLESEAENHELAIAMHSEPIVGIEQGIASKERAVSASGAESLEEGPHLKIYLGPDSQPSQRRISA